VGSVTEIANLGQLHNAALALIPTESELPQPTVDVRLPRIVRDSTGKVAARYERTVRLPKLRDTKFNGRFKPLTMDASTLINLATDPDLLTRVRPEQVIEAAVAYANAARHQDLMTVSRTLWYLLAAQRGAALSVHTYGAQTIETAEG
jgi:hypothetical protein